MFEVGTKVVHPMQGAGRIKAIVTEDALGVERDYFVLSMKNMDIKIPVDNVSQSGLREVVKSDMIDKVYDVLKHSNVESYGNWNKRYRENTEKIKSGDILEVTKVLKELYIRNEKKALSIGEKKMYDKTLKILTSEIALVTGIEENKVCQEIKNILSKIKR